MKDLTTDPGYWNLDGNASSSGVVSTVQERHADLGGGAVAHRPIWRKPLEQKIFVRIQLNTSDGGIRSGIERASRELGWELDLGDNNPTCEVHGILTNSSQIGDHVYGRSPALPTVVVEGNRVSSEHAVHSDWFPTIAPDLSSVGQLAAQHLLTLGRSHLAYFASANDRWSESIGSAFSGKCITAGIQPLMIAAPSGSPLERAKQLLAHLSKLPRPCAILADHDRHAVEILAAVHHLGLRVPEDIVVLGTGNLESVQQRSGIPVSSVDMNLDLLGYTAALLLDRGMRGETLQTRRWLIPPKALVARQSTDTSCCRIPGINKAVQIIRSQYAMDICVPSIARECGMSVRNLYRLYRISTGNTIGKDLMNQRMQAAKSLLLDPTLKLDPIAVKTGLGNARNLCRLFKEQFGQTPGQWRATYLVEPIAGNTPQTHRYKNQSPL